MFSSGYLHASAVKALGLVGIGRERPRILARDQAGRLDLEALEAALQADGGSPAIVVATAGDVNTGDFDPIRAMSVLARKYRAWLHIDGAFGLYAALSPHTRHLTDGIDSADSVAVDGHKWLNAPYDTGFAFVRDPAIHAGSFSTTAAYLRTEALARPVYCNLAVEMSRRARALPVWATLRAYGRDGYRAMVERHLALAQRVADQVDEAPDLERLADVPLNVVCFRFHPPDVPEADLDEMNRRLGAMVLEDGRVYFGTTEYAGKVAFRPAVVNWRTRRRGPHRDGRTRVGRETPGYGAGRLIGGRSESAGLAGATSRLAWRTSSILRASRFISRSPRSSRLTIWRRISS